MKLDISAHELEEAYEDILTILGAFSIEVDIEKKEVKIVLKRAFQEFEKETSIWQLQNQFSNVYGMPAGQQMFNQISTFNMNFVTQITDWFASMNRVGGKIPWHKDYFTLEPGRQIYDLSRESSKPYKPGTRRVHRIMWVATPEILSGTRFKASANTISGDDILASGAWNFTNSGLNYGGNPLMMLGYGFDTIMMLQSMETRKKILFSEFYYNLSGDMVELFPMPGGKSLSVIEGTKIFYYYWDEREVNTGGRIDPDLLDQLDSNSGIIKKIEYTGEINPSNRFFTLLGPIDPGSESVILNGATLKPNVDYVYNATDNDIMLTDEFRNLSVNDSLSIFATKPTIDSSEMSQIPPQQEMLIANPIQMKVDTIPWSMLSPWAKTWVWEWTLARCKYIQGAKWRKIKKTYNSSENGYEIEFDYGSLLSEAQSEMDGLRQNLRDDLKELNLMKLMQDKQGIVDAATNINKRGGRMPFIRSPDFGNI